ncbi:hypothetical protein OSH11_11115 [Kaistia dalseonensis]|uniref:Uncharacterized protein n=1 Tax=Kaistia dalseonensis TaxID=410840 RepID=A0ABU0H6B2_9HYPH|nr:hypothetical protein [Kaistia dalseonensis]MCX5495258.1 hypothetical protein [Kaistia dalseonensis]MDQ0437844.1 hypothetical protein [Kaistia dalseonensis]
MSTGPAAAARMTGLFPLMLAAFAWGLAEATYFPLVADILLSFVALCFGLRAGLWSALGAAIGAACGGLVLYRLAATDPMAARAMLDSVPFVSRAMIATGFAGIQSADWPLAMLKGSVTGIPYKVFAVGAGESGLSALAFFAVSIPVRLARFAVVALIIAVASHLLSKRLALAGRAVVLALFWIVFYAEFWLRWSGMEVTLIR